MHLFFTPDISGDLYQLNEEESKHCIRVLRLINGDIVYLIDGKGGFYKTEIIDAHPKRCALKVLELTERYGKRNFRLHIAIAPTKSIERIEWFLEKVTEMGVDEITPIICQRSERKEVKLDRLNKIIVSAMKQSLKAYQPKLNESIDFKRFIVQSNEKVKFIAHCLDAGRKSLGQSYHKETDVLVLIGPEGDFSEDEITLAMKHGFEPITLGESRLRTETAGIVACAQLNFMNE
ncbi:16S rRNA (uracil(1498)-N(3))-methyltransferase [Solitalea sp. MAHUQ-68]|uniref:Ribosomal RNA small subunit methyltransferase E n=1 Tax=Solitalea agri TaxID=2953739 RepID=A0A9X2F2R4_9SPHI|nr:16S rRNA (uracil(1498)-N(3))-methyltransferase [Solitalea agri]MCO4291286.1 16S rRNA (uracil(1498)-N(3))-methyltransferase [Solitalea agri]